MKNLPMALSAFLLILVMANTLGLICGVGDATMHSIAIAVNLVVGVAWGLVALSSRDGE